MDEPSDRSAPSSGQVPSAHGRFPCPSCSEMLRAGAIVCPYCDTDLRKSAHIDPEPPPTTGVYAWGPPLPPTTPADRRLALVSVIMGGTALLADVALYVMARRAPQLLVLVTILDWATLLFAILAIRLGRQAMRRVTNTSDKRGMMMAQVGLTFGWLRVAYTLVSLLIWPFASVTSSIRP